MTPPDDSACDHCALPLGRRALEAEIGGQPGRYCCGGCVLAATVTRAKGDPAVASALLVRLGLAGFFAMNVMMLTIPSYARYVYGEEGEGAMFSVLSGLAALLTVPVLLLLGGPVLRGALANLRRGRATSDVLLAIAVGAAFALSVANLWAGDSETYFDTTVLLLILVTAGRYVEASAKAEANETVRSAAREGQRRALLVVGDHRFEVDPAVLRPGHRVDVGPGDRIPADGRVLDGVGDVDESLLTGEPRPQWKGVGAAVAGGTCSIDGRFRIAVERAATESAEARIVRLLEDARRSPSEIERSVDRLASWMVPLVVLVAIGAAVAWSAFGEADRGVLAAVAVLVVACPCGLVLATPVAIARALSGAASRGIVVRTASVFERAAAVDTVFFDKTGTLTEVTPGVQRLEVVSGELEESRLLSLAAALEDGIGHPLARAIVLEAERRGLSWPRSESTRVVPGRGVRGVVDGTPVAVGNAAFVSELAEVPRSDGVWIATGGGAIARLELDERWATGASQAVGALRAAGTTVGLLTGDATPRAGLGELFEDGEVRAGLTPGEKLDSIVEARRGARVAMVGDGVNDTPALAAADVGIAVASASDLSRVSADVALLRGNVSLVPEFLAEARRVRRVVRQNLAWATGYNVAALALAAAAQLTPVVAALAMIGSSLIVLASSRRIGAASGAARVEKMSEVTEAIGLAQEPDESLVFHDRNTADLVLDHHVNSRS